MEQKPRLFRLHDELSNSSETLGINYGLQNPKDRTLTYWTGSFMANTGHVIGFTFVCDSSFPKTCPKVTFDESLRNKDPYDEPDEMKTYLKNIHKMYKSGSSDLNPSLFPVKAWTPGTTIGKFLSGVFDMITGKVPVS